MSADVRAAARRWSARDPDPETRAEVEGLLARDDSDALAERFATRVSFGTAGLRAPMMAGPAGMNRLVVRESAAGIARHLIRSGPARVERGVVIGHDARHNSAAFAADCADVLAAHAVPVTLSRRPIPTPILAFSIRHLGSAAGIMITASHNPAADNGLKLYLDDGAQIIPPTDAEIAAAINAVVTDGIIVPPGGARAPVRALDDGVTEAYRRATIAVIPRPSDRSVRIATTAMHGVGGRELQTLLGRMGHTDVHPVAEQETPDPDFPTVPFPNPEEPGATDLLRARMLDLDAELGLAVDPDADRVAVLARTTDRGVRHLSGDDVGALLGHWLLRLGSGHDRLVVSSIVSSSLVQRIAEAHGVRHVETLTGFKWLARPAIAHREWRQVLAYEESIGYAIGPDARDKDGLSAALAVAAMASECDLLATLEALHREHGAHVNENVSQRYAGPDWRERRAAALRALETAPPTSLGGLGVEQIRWLVPDVMRIDLTARVRVLVRPSGTEPKLKCYCEGVEPVAATEPVEAARTRASTRLSAVLSDLMGALAG